MNRQRLRDYGREQGLAKFHPEYRQMKFGDAPRKRYSDIGAVDLRGFSVGLDQNQQQQQHHYHLLVPKRPECEDSFRRQFLPQEQE